MGLQSFIKNESGQSAVFAALGFVVLIAFVGLAVDVGGLRYNEHKLQAAAEAAALAAALEVTPCQGTPNCAAMQAAAQSALTENGFTASSTTADCGAASGSSLRLLINNPPCFRGASDPNTGNANFAEAVVSETEKTYFARLVGYNNVPLVARAEAKRSANPNCIYALDPTGGNAITVDVLANLSATCGVVDESNAANAFSCNVLSGVNVTNLKITGGIQSLLCNSSPNPRTGVPVPTPRGPTRLSSETGGRVMRQQHFLAVSWRGGTGHRHRQRDTLSRRHVLRGHHDPAHFSRHVHARHLRHPLRRPGKSFWRSLDRPRSNGQRHGCHLL